MFLAKSGIKDELDSLSLLVTRHKYTETSFQSKTKSV